jgi:hypothetical protein
VIVIDASVLADVVADDTTVGAAARRRLLRAPGVICPVELFTA